MTRDASPATSSARRRYCTSCAAVWDAPVDACPICAASGWMLDTMNHVLDESLEPRNRLQGVLSRLRTVLREQTASNPSAIERTLDDALRALRTLKGYNEHIRDGKINFRADDHLAIIELGLTGWGDSEDGAGMHADERGSGS